ncbi:MAG: hypothetical protein LBQ60_01625 [Bacteroidales bacterium]|jgi:DNA mismatch repair ATPase MutS|nr:hypothetical protein [Bacteroidales bacterium]
MVFSVDNQTINDLEIFQSGKQKKSLSSFLDLTLTAGGSDRLYRMLNNPACDTEILNNRIAAIRFFTENDLMLDTDSQMLDFIEHYLNQSDYPTKFSSLKAIEKSIRNKLKPSNEFYVKKRGIVYLIDFLDSWHRHIRKFEEIESPGLIKKYNNDVLRLFNDPVFKEILGYKNKNKINPVALEKFDHAFRYSHKAPLRFLLDVTYEYDVFQAMSRMVSERDFCFPEILTSQEEILDIKGLFHPLIEQAITNDVTLTSKSNLAFLTGPNMAGKSTFLKSIGIIAYLAHCGFPVPAKKVRISTLSGLSTTINIPDNLNLGYSHFYSEVLRIKKVAESMKSNRNMLVIFDELFRGTNVKDALEGSLAVISAFSQVKSCFFAISTHIVEIAERLTEKDNILFCFLEIKSENGMPVYTYKLKEGVTDTRLGMYIIQQEKIIETIHAITDKNQNQ